MRWTWPGLMPNVHSGRVPLGLAVWWLIEWRWVCLRGESVLPGVNAVWTERNLGIERSGVHGGCPATPMVRGVQALGPDMWKIRSLAGLRPVQRRRSGHQIIEFRLRRCGRSLAFAPVICLACRDLLHYTWQLTLFASEAARGYGFDARSLLVVSRWAREASMDEVRGRACVTFVHRIVIAGRFGGRLDHWPTGLQFLGRFRTSAVRGGTFLRSCACELSLIFSGEV